MAKRRKSSQQQSRSSILILIVVLIVLSAIAGIFFKDYRQVPYNWFIVIIWLAASFFSLAFGILYYAQFILPHHEGESWLEGVAMLLRGGLQLSPPPKRSINSEEFPGQRFLPISFDSLNAGILRSHQVLAINQGTQFARAAGPGYVRLTQGESIGQVIDLRKHVRKQEVTVNTRDGIPLDMIVSVTFQIKQVEQKESDNQSEYPYLKSAIFQVSQAGSFDADNELLPWSEQLAPQAATYLVSEVAQFTLNELSREPNLLNGVQNRVRRLLRINFDSMGIKVFNVSVSLRNLPQEIIDQRMENWRAPWQSQIHARKAVGDAHKIRRIKQARAKAQVEIIQNIMQNIEELRQKEDTPLPQVVTLRMLEVLDEVISSPSLQEHVPGPVLTNLTVETTNQMQSLLGPTDEGEDRDS
ncbi:MAG: SPFH domain-containing protein [Candidatus Promineifilaceae bacterium]|nr:SPFH domain-containing protein [Candidatus Promineifilaceae bacterium]